MEPNFDTYTYDGSVVIDLDVYGDADTVTLDASTLNFTDVSLTLAYNAGHSVVWSGNPARIILTKRFPPF